MTTQNSVNNTAAQTTVNNNNNKGETTMTRYNFAQLFPAVANLQGINAALVTSTQTEVTVASLLADMVFNTTTTVDSNDVNYAIKVRAQEAKVAKRNAFVNAWAAKLGYVNTEAKITVDVKSPLLRGMVSKLQLVVANFDVEGCGTRKVVINGVTLEHNEKGIPCTATANEIFFNLLAQATAGLTAEEYTQLVLDLNNNTTSQVSKASSTAVKIRHITVDFKAGTLEKGYTMEVNKGLLFFGESVDVVGAHALFLLTLSLAGKSQVAINSIIAAASNVFKREENYGATAASDDIRYHVNNNLVLCAKTAPVAVFPFFQVKSAKQANNALAHVLNKGIFAAVDKTNIKWMTVDAGARAMGLGYDADKDVVLNISDASKPSKVYNRPASLKYSFAHQDARTNSNFAFVVDEDKLAFLKGRALRTIYTNSRFCPGSGVALTNPELSFNYSVNTTLTEPVNILTFPAEVRGTASIADYRKALIADINEQIQNAQGKVFAPGQAILTVNVGGENRVLMSNTKKAVSVRVDNTLVVESEFNEDVIDVKAYVTIVGNDKFLKLRTAFYKATTLPYAVDVEAVNNSDWDIILNNETVKGQNALMVMWANEQEGVVKVDMDNGIAICADGRVIDLTVLENEIAEWRRARVQTTTLTFDVARSIYEELIHQFTGKDDVKVISKTATKVTVEETVEYITGTLHFDIEIATPKECVGTSTLTFEQQSAILLQDKELGQTIMNGLGKGVVNMNALVDAYSGNNAVTSFNVTYKEGRDAFAEAAFNGTGSFVKYVSNHRSILSVLAKRFPAGIELVQLNSKLSIQPQALLSFGQFSKNGSSAREVAKVVDFINFLMNVDYNNAAEIVKLTEAVVRTAKVVRSWSANLVKSSNALKKVTRAGKVVCGKVRTSYAEYLHSADGIPMLALNRNCPMVKLLGVKLGDLVAINRTPMPFITVARVIFNNDVEVAHAALSPLWWHFANEGK